MRFIDEVTLTIKAGDGGNGAVAFRRERFKPRGGPCGGDGGRGGDVVISADRNLHTLLDLRARPRVEASRGRDGQGNDRHGKGGEPLEIRVPVGTIVKDADKDALIGDLTEHGQEVVAARGGQGGRGNMRFVTTSNRAPRRADPGERGESKTIHLELKLLADVGLLGLPNVGKSTLISRLSSARPKVADYPFTTLTPNLGVVELGPGSSFVMADIPGLIRGAAQGAGLGTQFLRHIQRTAVLLHVLAPTGELEEDDLEKSFDDLNKEIAAFDEELAGRPQLVALNKADLPHTLEAEPRLRRALAERGYDLIVVSAASGQGLEDLKRRLGAMILERASPDQ